MSDIQREQPKMLSLLRSTQHLCEQGSPIQATSNFPLTSRTKKWQEEQFNPRNWK